MPPKKILILGEFCIDQYIIGDANYRINPESPSYLMKYKKEEIKWGMAGNVYKNIESLRPNWTIDFLHQHENIIKQRMIDEKSGYILFRLDFEEPVSKLDVTKLNLMKYDAVIFSSYNKGFLTKNIIKNISEFCNKNNIITFCDCKFNLGEWSKTIDFVKINAREYESLTNHSCKNLIVTLGKGGVRYNNKIFPAKEVNVVDPVGAGDVFLSCFAVKYLETKNIDRSIIYAIKGASYSVTQRGTTIVNENIMSSF